MKQPTAFQLALAIAVVTSKPANIAIKDHLSDLKTYILDGNCAQDHGSKQKYLEAAGYWRCQYQEAQREIDRLLDEKAQLEREKALLEKKCQPHGIGEVSTTHVGFSLKPEPQSNASILSISNGNRTTKRDRRPVKDERNLKTKRPKISNGLTPSEAPFEQSLDQDMPSWEHDLGLTPTILRHLHDLQLLYKIGNPALSAVAYHIIECSKAVAEHLSTAALELQKEVTEYSKMTDRARSTAVATMNVDRNLKNMECAVFRTFVSLFHGLKLLWNHEQSRARDHGAATYQMVHTIEIMLSTVTNCCRMGAEKFVGEKRSVHRNSMKSAQARSKAPDKPERVIIAQEISRLVLTIISGLCPRPDGPHRAFYEGVLYLLIDLAAQRLHTLNFIYPPGTSLETEISLSDKSILDPIIAKAHALEVRFILQILERLLQLAPSFLNQQAQSKGARVAKSRTATLAGRSKQSTPSLGAIAKEKLQRTLAECIFGKHEGGDDDFIEVLRKPIALALIPPPPKVEVDDLSDWFTREMWKLIGWDILSRNGESWSSF